MLNAIIRRNNLKNTYRNFIQKIDDTEFVFLDKWIDHLHVWLLGSDKRHMPIIQFTRREIQGLKNNYKVYAS